MITVVLSDNIGRNELKELCPELNAKELFLSSSLKSVILDKRLQILTEEDMFYLKLKELNYIGQVSEITEEELDIIKEEILISNKIWKEFFDKDFCDIYNNYHETNNTINLLIKNDFISQKFQNELLDSFEQFFDYFNKKSQIYIKSQSIIYNILTDNLKGITFNENDFKII